jgi:asparagine synthase (glutamine-hydrolysing)
VCGLAGLVSRKPLHLSAGGLEGLFSLLRHRGPDDRGVLLFDGQTPVVGRHLPTGEWIGKAILMHTRLSILDLSEAGWQPMVSQDGHHYILFNGEIYNYVELRRELETLGYCFRSNSDTEVLLAAYCHWGIQALNRLVGMFAFAVFDCKERRLFLARDPFGIKPLYYSCGTDTFAFSSEIKPLLAQDWVSRSVNPTRVYEYLRYGVTDHGSETMFAAISSLRPAHYLEVSFDQPDRVEPVRYWSIDLSHHLALSVDAAAERLRELFLESVRLHLRSDVPVGAALSGGIDSSAIVTAMRQLAGHDLKINTFTFVPAPPGTSERDYVEDVARKAHLTAHFVTPRAEDIVGDIERLIEVQEEPFTSTSIYAQYRVFKLAREAGVKVMLDGQGGDELLGGYRHYLGPRLASLLRHGRFVEGARFLAAAGHLPGETKWSVAMGAGACFLPDVLHARMRRLVGKDLRPGWFNADWLRSNEISSRPLTYTAREKETLRHTLYRSLVGVGLPALLRYEDRNSMAFSIESRVPFLTPALAGFLLALPEEHLIDPNGLSKRVFRDAMRGVVPDRVLDRRDKVGFATPEKAWLLALRPWIETVLSSEALSSVPALNPRKVRNEWAAIAKGRQEFDSRVWRWCNLIVWSKLMRVSFT